MGDQITTVSEYEQHSVNEIATEVAMILKQHMDASDVLKLLEIVFLDTKEDCGALQREGKDYPLMGQ